MTDTYTLEVYKADKRTKTGERVEIKVDYPEGITEKDIRDLCEWRYPAKKGYRYEIHQTYVERVSAMDATKTFLERYDTPYYCSPSSETYWCS